MMSLAELQAQVTAAMLGRQTHAGNWINHSSSLSADARLGIYQSSVQAQLVAVLESTFKTVLLLVGEDFFQQMAIAYIEQFPSKHPDLEYYGSEFAGFVSAYAPAITLPYLADCCRLDYAIQCAYWAKDMVDLTQYAEVGEEQLQQWLQQARLFQVKSDYPVLSIRRYCLDAEQQREDFDLKGSAAETCLVFRSNGVVYAIDEPGV